MPCLLDQTPPPRELKVSDPKVRDLSLLQLDLVPTAVLHVKFLDEALNRESLSLEQPSTLPYSASFVDNDVQAPLVPSALAAAIDPPLASNTSDSDNEPQSRSVKTLGSTPPGSSTSTRKGKASNLELNTEEAQKKFGKFFKGLGPSKASYFAMILKLILHCSARDMSLVRIYLWWVMFISSPTLWYATLCLRAIVYFHIIVDVHPTIWPPFLQDHSFSH